MNAVILYYSLSNNNRILAEALGKKLRFPVFEIQEAKTRSRLTIFIDLIFNRNPKVSVDGFELGNYDHIILVAPIWIGQIATPLRSFLRKNKGELPPYSFITFCGGIEGVREKVYPQLTKLTAQTPTVFEVLAVNDVQGMKGEKNPNRVMSYQLNENDLRQFENRLRSFCTTVQAATETV